MEFITVEQFKEQPEEVQEVFLDWWKPSIGDLYHAKPPKCDNGFVTFYYLEKENYGDFIKALDFITPLFTEGQLRKIVEDKGNCLLDIKVENLCDEYNEYTVIGWEINKFDYRREFGRILFEDCIGAKDLLELYWKMACSIAKEHISNN